MSREYPQLIKCAGYGHSLSTGGAPQRSLHIQSTQLRQIRADCHRPGTAHFDSSLIGSASTREDVSYEGLPYTNLATTLGSPKAANMIALGTYLVSHSTLDRKSAIHAMMEKFHDKTSPLRNQHLCHRRRDGGS